MTVNAWFEGFSIWCQREMMIDCELVPFYIRKKDLGHGSLPSFSAYFWVFFTVLFYARIFGRRVGNPGMDISNNAVSSRTKAGGMACASLNTTVGVCLLLAELPPSIGTPSEYRNHLRVSATPPSIGTPSEYRQPLRVSATPPSIGNPSEYRTHLRVSDPPPKTASVLAVSLCTISCSIP